MYVTTSWELFLVAWLSRQVAFSISFSGSFQWKSESRFATRSTIEDSRFRGTGDEKEAMNSVIGQQTASPTSSPSWLPLCLSLVPSLDLLLCVSLPFLLFRCLLFPITQHIHTYVRSIWEVTLLQDAWPWTSQRFFEVSRTETRRNHVDRVTLPCDFLLSHLGRIVDTKRAVDSEIREVVVF